MRVNVKIREPVEPEPLLRYVLADWVTEEAVDKWFMAISAFAASHDLAAEECGESEEAMDDLWDNDLQQVLLADEVVRELLAWAEAQRDRRSRDRRTVHHEQ
jgi:hypothetical protein